MNVAFLVNRMQLWSALITWTVEIQFLCL